MSEKDQIDLGGGIKAELDGCGIVLIGDSVEGYAGSSFNQAIELSDKQMFNLLVAWAERKSQS